jgi:hypothetical protein
METLTSVPREARNLAQAVGGLPDGERAGYNPLAFTWSSVALTEHRTWSSVLEAERFLGR